MHISQLMTETRPQPAGEWWPWACSPWLAGAWGLIMWSISVTSSAYLTTHQSENCMNWLQSPWPLFSRCVLKPTLKNHQEIQVFWALAAHSPCLGTCNKGYTFLHHLVSTNWLCCVSGKWTQVWFGNKIEYFLCLESLLSAEK